MDARDWRDAVLEALRLAVRRRMVADVPGRRAALRRARLVAGGGAAGRGGPGRAQDVQRRLPRRRRASPATSSSTPTWSPRHFGTDHQQILVDPARMLPAVDDAITAMAEPMVSHDCVAFYLLSEEVTKSVTVVQSGQGADEVFAGYDWYPPLAGVPRDTGGRARTRAVFTDRPHAELAEHPGAGVAARPRPEPGVRRRALRRRRAPTTRWTRRCAWTRRSCWWTTRSSGSTT